MTRTDGDADSTPTADLVAVLAAVAVAALVVFSPLGEWRPLAVAVGVPFALVVPGYALVSAAFPRAGDVAPTASTRTSWVARLGLSAAGSVVAVAIVGWTLDFTVWGFQRSAVVAGLCLLTVAATALAWGRRRRLTDGRPAGADRRAVASRVRTVVAGEGVLGIALTLVVVVAAAAAVGVVADASTDRGDVTEFYVLGENDSGALTAGSVPSEMTVDRPTTVGIGVGAYGSNGFEGTVVGRLERVTVDGDAVTVEDSRELVSFPVAVDAGESTVTRHTVSPQRAGDRLRLTYRLYREGTDAPTRAVHVWVTVEPPA
ncbi:DUF1616 domain-containing protein [Haloarcula marina]|uniref:DUF1616 domain-containing protein n=1 Tax=Haloarcula marina TaxID=2961574 RepID=UPI0020B8C397|nr:DUF1616 domain-containing protein [Halomicroarcula marina]